MTAGKWLKRRLRTVGAVVGFLVDVRDFVLWVFGSKIPAAVGAGLLAAYGLLTAWRARWADQPAVLQVLLGLGVFFLMEAALVWAWKNRERLLRRDLDVRVRVGGISAAAPSPMEDTDQEWWKIDIGGVRISNPSSDKRVDLTFRLIAEGEDGRERALTEGWEPPSLTRGYPPVIQYLQSPLTVEPRSTVPEQGYGRIRFVVSPHPERFGVRGFWLDILMDTAELEVEDLISGKRIRRKIQDLVNPAH